MQLKAFTGTPTPLQNTPLKSSAFPSATSGASAFITPNKLPIKTISATAGSLNQRTQQPILSLRAAPDDKGDNKLTGWFQKISAQQNASASQTTRDIIETYTKATFENREPEQLIDEKTNSSDQKAQNKQPESPKHLMEFGTAIAALATALASQSALPTDAKNIENVINWKDALVSISAGGGAAAWVKLWSNLTEQGLVDSKLSRKLIHMSSAPLFMASWPLFSDDPNARFVAAAVPLIQLGRLIAASQDDNSELASTISRSNKGAELLKGPAIYTGILALATLAWRNSFASVAALTQMAVGDGMADIVGRNFAPKDGSGRIPWNTDKSIVGTLGYIAAASAATWGMVNWFASQGMLTTDTPVLPAAIALSTICGLIETLPADKIKIDDNISVPLAAALLGHMIFSGQV